MAYTACHLSFFLLGLPSIQPLHRHSGWVSLSGQDLWMDVCVCVCVCVRACVCVCVCVFIWFSLAVSNPRRGEPLSSLLSEPLGLFVCDTEIFRTQRSSRWNLMSSDPGNYRGVWIEMVQQSQDYHLLSSYPRSPSKPPAQWLQDLGSSQTDCVYCKIIFLIFLSCFWKSVENHLFVFVIWHFSLHSTINITQFILKKQFAKRKKNKHVFNMKPNLKF